MSNISSTLAIHPYNWSYAKNPDISESVYWVATVYMAIIGTFGAVSISAVIIAFLAAQKKVRHMLIIYVNKDVFVKFFDGLVSRTYN
jgi:hypothetical protein